MKNGHFYFSHTLKDETPAPKIKSIEADWESGEISIEATDYDRIIWISDEKEIHEGDILRIYTLPPEKIGTYLRARLIRDNDEGVSCTQPMVIKQRAQPEITGKQPD